jgi:hypothetical protein
MMLDGVLYPLPKLVQITKEKDGFAWPTPAARDYKDCGSPSEFSRKSPGLTAWQTPTVQDANGRTHHNQKNGGKILSLLGQAGGKLNPMWVEWLMGLPLGHTELSHWVTEWFLSKSKQRLKS